LYLHRSTARGIFFSHAPSERKGIGSGEEGCGNQKKKEIADPPDAREKEGAHKLKDVRSPRSNGLKGPGKRQRSGKMRGDSRFWSKGVDARGKTIERLRERR